MRYLAFQARETLKIVKGLVAALLSMAVLVAGAQTAPPQNAPGQYPPAQNPAKPVQSTAPEPGPIIPNTPAPTGGEVYKIKPEDVLRIQVFNHQEILADVPVGEDGRVSAPFIGLIQAEGRTTNDLETELTVKYREKLRLRDPIVSVAIVKFRDVHATVGGSVQRPSTYTIRQGDTVMALLNMGGGAIPDVADLRRAFLQRANSRELIPIDLYAMTVRGDTSQNYVLEDGDILTVPEETNNRINIQGKVQTPGQYPYREDMTLADAIALAHGEVPDRARMSKIVIARQKVGLPGQYVRINADFVRFVSKGDSTQNVVLQPGDFIYVPETNTPDFNYISALANAAYIINYLGTGSFFGLHIFH